MNDPPGNTLDQAIDQLYDPPIIALQRQALDIERDYRDLAQRDDLAVDTSAHRPRPPKRSLASPKPSHRSATRSALPKNTKPPPNATQHASTSTARPVRSRLRPASSAG